MTDDYLKQSDEMFELANEATLEQDLPKAINYMSRGLNAFGQHQYTNLFELYKLHISLMRSATRKKQRKIHERTAKELLDSLERLMKTSSNLIELEDVQEEK